MPLVVPIGVIAQGASFSGNVASISFFFFFDKQRCNSNCKAIDNLSHFCLAVEKSKGLMYFVEFELT